MNNKGNCLYLLGAGASCEVLPLVSNFVEKLNGFATKLSDYINDVIHVEQEDYIKLGNELLVDTKWLARESDSHYSVDTFAKKLYFIDDDENLHKLKTVLSVYLVIEQSRTRVDKRYDAFLASVLSKGQSVTLPEHLRILTWNYDRQLDKAMYGFCKNQKVKLREMKHHHIHAINGSCLEVEEIYNSENKPAWERGINLYKDCMDSHSEISPQIDFAWEYNVKAWLNKDINYFTQDVTDIIVIGYSFPYFNRDIDTLLFNKCERQVERIYLQCGKQNDVVEERLKACLRCRPGELINKNIKFNQITSVGLFFIPDNF